MFSYQRSLFFLLFLFLIIPTIAVGTNTEALQKKEVALSTPSVIRVLIGIKQSLFPYQGKKQQSIAYMMLDNFKKYLNKVEKVKFEYIPVSHDLLPFALHEGKGEMAVGLIPITEETKRLVHFSLPYLQHAQCVFRHFASRDFNLFEGYSFIFPKLEAGPVLSGSPSGKSKIALVLEGCFNETVQVTWAIHKNQPQLKEAADRFLTFHPVWTSYAADRASPDLPFENAIGSGMPMTLNQKKLAIFSPLFQLAASLYRIDWLLLLAIGMRETNLRHVLAKKGPTGVMQVAPVTARRMGIKNPNDPKENIAAAARYLQYLTELFSDPAIDPGQRLLFVLAAYNAGEGRVKKLRSKAEKMGLDPNRWSGAVEKVAQQMVGIHLLRYVNWVSGFYKTMQIHHSFRLPPSGSKPAGKQFPMGNAKVPVAAGSKSNR